MPSHFVFVDEVACRLYLCRIKFGLIHEQPMNYVESSGSYARYLRIGMGLDVLPFILHLKACTILETTKFDI